MHKIQRHLLNLFVAGLALSLPSAFADGLGDITERGVLKVAVPQDFPPFGSIGPDMQPRGLDIDTAQLLADQLAVVKQLASEGMTLIMVTHEMRFAREVGDPRQLFAGPRTAELGQFIGPVNL
jgi:ABC-type amino acid transport substrate-binding protein